MGWDEVLKATLNLDQVLEGSGCVWYLWTDVFTESIIQVWTTKTGTWGAFAQACICMKRALKLLLQFIDQAKKLPTFQNYGYFPTILVTAYF
jgi:hypothetical protein